VLVAAKDVLLINPAQSLFRVAEFDAGSLDDPHDTARRVLAVAVAIERILRDYFRREWSRAQARDVELLNKASKQLNVEANDILEYQHW
jgi:hypothetical protein